MDYKERAIEELELLQAKIQRLGDFMEEEPYWKLPSLERTLMRGQHESMKMYAHYLSQRIMIWKTPASSMVDAVTMHHSGSGTPDSGQTVSGVETAAKSGQTTPNQESL